MRPLALLRLLALVIAAGSCCGGEVSAQQSDDRREKTADGADKDWYYATTTHAKQKPIVQQKAELKAQHRMARLEASRWYGISPSRPIATAIPYTSMYSPASKRPSGRPFAWHPGGSYEYVLYQPYYYSYYR